MNAFSLTAAACAASLALFVPVLPVSAQTPAPRYQWTAGETLRYLVQRDPYFADPADAIETVTSDADYRPPVVERLTEHVQSVGADGTATLRLTLAPEPGFEDDAYPQAPLTRTVVVTAAGHIISVSEPALGDSPEDKDLLRGLVSISPVLHTRQDGLAVANMSGPRVVTQTTSPDHDGTLLQTTQAADTAHEVFDCRRGQLVRTVCTRTISLSLVMTGRGRRGSDDFGHVIPNSQVIQTLSVERQAN